MSSSKPEVPDSLKWSNQNPIPSTEWICGYCGNRVATNEGFTGNAERHGALLYIHTCPRCKFPTVFDKDGAWHSPVSAPGRTVSSVSADTEALYEEARRSAGAEAYTAAVMACRVILSHIAVEKGAKPRDTFSNHIDHLQKSHYIPPEGSELADYVKGLGNDANHKLVIMDREDAEACITFVESLLRLIYELPGRIPNRAKSAASEPPDD